MPTNQTSDRRICWPALVSLLFALFAYLLPTPKGKEWLDLLGLAAIALNVLSLVMYWRRSHV